MNPLADDPLLRIVPGSRTVVSSGWVVPDAGAGGQFAWGPRAREAFDGWCERVRGPLSKADAVVLFLPAAEHVLSDAQSCLSFLRARAGQPFGVVLDPALLLTPAMLGRAEDHLRRAVEALGEHPALACVRLTNAAVERGESGPVLRAVPLHAGVLDAGLLASLVRERVRPGVPVALLPDEIDRQAALLAGPGAGARNGG